MTRNAALLLAGIGVLILLAFSLSMFEKRELATARVLFVGNSLTTGQNVPGRMGRLGLHDGYSLQIRVVARNGARLIDFLSDADLEDALAEENWDGVVLQDNSQTALRPGDRMASARAISEISRRAGAAAIVLFPSWPAGLGHPIYEAAKEDATMPASPGDFAEMTLRHFDDVAKNLDLVLAPIPQAWLSSPNSGKLFAQDRLHASPAGAELSAKVLWEALRAAFEADRTPAE